MLCASQGYLERRGPFTNPNDLGHHDCLVHSNDPVWRIGHGHESTLHKIRNVAFSSNSYIALQKACVHGRGIALLPVRPAYDDLMSGTLKVLLPDLPVPSRSLYAIYGPAQQAPRKVEVFLGFLTEWFSANPIPALPRGVE